jgi:hypothetical protein
VERFRELAARTVLVSEIGLDTDFCVPLELQLHSFRQALDFLSEIPRLISIHGFRASGLVIEELRRRPIVALVLHCWTRSNKETREAVALGCFFSAAGTLAGGKRSWLRRSPCRHLIPQRVDGIPGGLIIEGQRQGFSTACLEELLADRGPDANMAFVARTAGGDPGGSARSGMPGLPLIPPDSGSFMSLFGPSLRSPSRNDRRNDMSAETRRM